MGGADYGRHRRRLYRAGRMDSANMEPGILSDLLVNGVIAGLGSVLVFLPQITILFAFILLLEDSGYLPRARFCWTTSWQKAVCRDARLSRFCRVSPVPFPP